MSCLLAYYVVPSQDALALEQVAETLGDGVIVTVSSPAHEVLKIVGCGECSSVHADELPALGRVDQDPVLWLVPPGSHVQGLQDHKATYPLKRPYQRIHLSRLPNDVPKQSTAEILPLRAKLGYHHGCVLYTLTTLHPLALEHGVRSKDGTEDNDDDPD